MSAREHLSETLAKMGIRGEIEERTLPDLTLPYFNVVTDEAQFFIRDGAKSLYALEYVVRRLVERGEADVRASFFLDVNGYRYHQIEALKTEAKNIAKRVRLYRAEIVLEPMSAFERRMVHIALAEYPDITTQSVGEGEERRVVVKPYP